MNVSTSRIRILSAIAAVAIAAPLAASPSPSTAADATKAGDARAQALPEDIKVLTYNVLGPSAAQNELPKNRWGPRRDAVVKVIKDDSPGIFGLQEASTSSAGSAAPWLIDQFAPGWDVYDPSNGSGTGSPKLIFFKSARFALVDKGAVAFEKNGCDEGRQMSWVVLQEKSDPSRRYWVGNTHLFAQDTAACRTARAAAVAKIHTVINAENPGGAYPIIMMGDFNNRPAGCYGTTPDAQRGKPISDMVAAKSAYNLAATVGLSNCTPTANANWPDGSANPQTRIDFIFRSSSFFGIVNTDIIGDRSVPFTTGGSGTPSDHFAVTARLSLLK